MNARDNTTREIKTMTVEVSAEISADASTPVEAQLEIQMVPEQKEDEGDPTATGSEQSDQGSGGVRVSEFFSENIRNGRSRGDEA